MRRRKDVSNRSVSVTYQLRRHNDVSAWSAASQPIWALNGTSLQRPMPGGLFLYVCKQTLHKPYRYITREFLGLRMRRFQGSILIRMKIYREIFKSALVYFNVFFMFLMALMAFKSFFCNVFWRNAVHHFYFFCLYISQPQNVLNLFLFSDQFQPCCSYKKSVILLHHCQQANFSE